VWFTALLDGLLHVELRLILLPVRQEVIQITLAPRIGKMTALQPPNPLLLGRPLPQLRLPLLHSPLRDGLQCPALRSHVILLAVQPGLVAFLPPQILPNKQAVEADSVRVSVIGECG